MTVCIVPIYDARKVDANFYDLVLNIEQLNHINRKIPAGSCVVVAYTLNTWGKPTTINVSFNVKWVMVLGAPTR
jgi:hypothetical protein